MPSLNIRDVPSEIHAVLAEEARRSHRSLRSVVLAALAEYAERAQRRRRMAQAVKELDALRETIHLREGMLEDSVAMIQEDRER